MDLGQGIAIAGLWIFAGMGTISKHLTASGTWIVWIISTIFTIVIL